MNRERIVWVVAVLLIGGIGFFSGQFVGVRTGASDRQAAQQAFFQQRGGTQSGAGGTAGGTAGGRGVSGTVASIDGSTITLTTRAGQTVKVQLAANGTVRKQADGQLSDITKGEQIVAIGAQNGDTVQATSIQIGGGFGGGQRSQAPGAAAPAP